MPIYDYRCDHCGHVFSAVQSFKDSALEACPSCGKRPRRLILAPAVVFKGSGWYKTDSRTPPKGESDAAKSETKGDATSGVKSETKGDAKGETKSGASPASPAKPSEGTS